MASSGYWKTRLGFDADEAVSTHHTTGGGRLHHQQPQPHSAPPVTGTERAALGGGNTTVYPNSNAAEGASTFPHNHSHHHFSTLPSIRGGGGANVTSPTLPKRRFSQQLNAGGGNSNNGGASATSTTQRSGGNGHHQPQPANPIATSAYYHFLGGGGHGASSVSPVTATLSAHNLQHQNSSPQSSARNHHGLSNSGTFGASMNSVANYSAGIHGISGNNQPHATGTAAAGERGGHRLSVGDNNIFVRQNTLGPLRNVLNAHNNNTATTTAIHNSQANNTSGSGGGGDSSAISTARGDGTIWNSRGASMASLPGFHNSSSTGAMDPPSIHHRTQPNMYSGTHNNDHTNNFEDDEMDRVFEEDFGSNNNNAAAKNSERGSNISPTFLGNRTSSTHGLVDPGKIGRSASRGLVPPVGRRSDQHKQSANTAYNYSSTTSSPPNQNFNSVSANRQLEEEEQELARRLERLNHRVAQKREWIAKNQQFQQVRDAHEVDRIMTNKKEEAELLIRQKQEEADLAARRKREHNINAMRRELLRALKKKGVFTMSNAAVLAAATRVVDEDEAAAEAEQQRIAALKEQEAKAFGGGTGSSQKSSAFAVSGKRTSLTGTLNDYAYNNNYRKNLPNADVDGDAPPSPLKSDQPADAGRQRELLGIRLVAYLDEYLINKYGEAILIEPTASTSAIGSLSQSESNNTSSPPHSRARRMSIKGGGPSSPAATQQRQNSIFSSTQRMVAYDKIMILDDDDEDIGLSNDGPHHHVNKLKSVESIATAPTSLQQSPTDATLPQFGNHMNTRKPINGDQQQSQPRRRSLSSSSSSSAETDNSSFSSLEGALVTALSLPRSNNTNAIISANGTGNSSAGVRHGRRAMMGGGSASSNAFNSSTSPTSSPLFPGSTSPRTGARASFSVASYGGLLPRRRSVSPSGNVVGAPSLSGSPISPRDAQLGSNSSVPAQAANPTLSLTTTYDLTYFDEEKIKRFVDLEEKAEALRAKQQRIASGEEEDANTEKEGTKTEIVVDDDGYISEVVVSSSAMNNSNNRPKTDLITVNNNVVDSTTNEFIGISSSFGGTRDALYSSNAYQNDHPLFDGGASDYTTSRPLSAAATNKSTSISVAEAGRQRRAHMRQMEQRAEAERNRAISDAEIKQLLKKIKYRQRRAVILSEISKHLDAPGAEVGDRGQSAMVGGHENGLNGEGGIASSRSDYLRGKYGSSLSVTSNTAYKTLAARGFADAGAYHTLFGNAKTKGTVPDPFSDETSGAGARSSSVIGDYFATRRNQNNTDAQQTNDDNQPSSLASIVRAAIETASKLSAERRLAAKKAMKTAKRKLLDEGLVEDTRVVANSKKAALTSSIDSSRSKEIQPIEVNTDNDPYEFLTQTERKFIEIVRKQRKAIKNELYEAERQLRRQEGKNRRRIGTMNTLVGAYENRLAAEAAEQKRIQDEADAIEQAFLRQQKKERLIFWNSYITDVVQKIAEEEAAELDFILSFRATASENEAIAAWRQRTYDEISGNPSKKKELLSKISSFEVPIAVFTALQSQLGSLFPHIPAFAAKEGGASATQSLTHTQRKKSSENGFEATCAQSANSDDPSLFIANASNMSAPSLEDSPVNLPKAQRQISGVSIGEDGLVESKPPTTVASKAAAVHTLKPLNQETLNDAYNESTTSTASFRLGSGQPLYLSPSEWRTLRSTIDTYQRHLLTILNSRNSAQQGGGAIGEGSINPLSFLSGMGGSGAAGVVADPTMPRGFSVSPNTFPPPSITPRRNNSDSTTIASVSQGASKASSPSRGDLMGHHTNSAVFGFNNTRTYGGGGRVSTDNGSPGLSTQNLIDHNAPQPTFFLPNRHAGRNNSNSPSTVSGATTPSLASHQRPHHHQFQQQQPQQAQTPTSTADYPFDAAAAEAIIASLNMHLGMGNTNHHNHSATSMSFLSGSTSGIGTGTTSGSAAANAKSNIATSGLPSLRLQTVCVVESIEADRCDVLLGKYMAYQRGKEFAAALVERVEGRKAQQDRETKIFGKPLDEPEQKDKDVSKRIVSPLFFDFLDEETQFAELLAVANSATYPSRATQHPTDVDAFTCPPDSQNALAGIDIPSFVSELLSVAKSRDSLELFWADSETGNSNVAEAVPHRPSASDAESDASVSLIPNLADTARRTNSISASNSISAADDSITKRMSVFCGASSDTVVGANNTEVLSYAGPTADEENGVNSNKRILMTLIANSRKRWLERNRLLDDLAVMSLLTSKLRRLKR